MILELVGVATVAALSFCGGMYYQDWAFHKYLEESGIIEIAESLDEPSKARIKESLEQACKDHEDKDGTN